MTHEEQRAKWADYQAYKAEGHTNKEVAKHFGIAYETAKRICRGVNPQHGHTNQHTKTTENEKRAYVESFLPIGFSYVGGYIDSDHKVTIQCKVCGSVFDRSMVSIRQKQAVICACCLEADRIEKQTREQKQKERERIERQNQARERLIQKEAERQAKTRTVVCEVCGNTFITRNPFYVCCSSECSRKRLNRISSHRKDNRITNDKRIDKDITAIKLYERDCGVCWICGGLCDVDDYIIRDGHFIAGNNYPSIDHIKPICEGGEDSWNNVRLAHRYCNSLRFWN